MRYVIILAGLFLTACGADPVYLKHADGRTIQCGPFDRDFKATPQTAIARERGCIDDYQRQGFVRVPKP